MQNENYYARLILYSYYMSAASNAFYSTPHSICLLVMFAYESDNPRAPITYPIKQSIT